MPIIDLTNLTEGLYTYSNVSDFDNYVSHSPTSYSYLSSSGHLITLLGSGITVDGSNIPTGGSITEVRIDLSNNNPETPDVVVTGLSFAATDLSYESGITASQSFWSVINQGETEVLPPTEGGTSLFGDQDNLRGGTLLASDDILHVGAFHPASTIHATQLY